MQISSSNAPVRHAYCQHRRVNIHVDSQMQDAIFRCHPMACPLELRRLEQPACCQSDEARRVNSTTNGWQLTPKKKTMKWTPRTRKRSPPGQPRPRAAHAVLSVLLPATQPKPVHEQSLCGLAWSAPYRSPIGDAWMQTVAVLHLAHVHSVHA